MNKSGTKHLDFRALLQQEFIKRCKNNKAYSIRSFAVNLKIDHSSLSRILSGSRKLSKPMISKIGLRLGLDPIDISKYQTIEESGTLENRRSALQITTDQFRFISDWYCLAFLELIKIDPIQDVRVYAKRLGITVIELQSAIDILTRLGFLSRDEKGNFLDLTKGTTDSCSFSYTSEAKKNYQKQVFKLALEAIDDFEIEQRSHSGMTMAINSKKLDEAKLKIAVFREQLCEFLQEGELDEVYHLGVGLFPLTKKLKKNTKENSNE